MHKYRFFKALAEFPICKTGTIISASHFAECQEDRRVNVCKGVQDLESIFHFTNIQSEIEKHPNYVSILNNDYLSQQQYPEAKHQRLSYFLNITFSISKLYFYISHSTRISLIKVPKFSAVVP